MPPSALEIFARDVVKLAHAHAAKALINSDIDLAREIGADGVHLTSAQLLECARRPDLNIVAASTHTRTDIERAAELDLDFVVLGAVKETPTHPGAPPMGWARFSALVAATPLPVFALGGMSRDDLPDAIEHGAHGVAMQRGLIG